MSHPNTADGFWSLVERSPTCWDWRGKLTKAGYGQFNASRLSSSFLAHRIAWLLTGRKIPEGLTLDHLCRNRRCVNPDHLEAVTQRVNTMRGFGISVRNAARTHCLHGHPLNGRKARNRYCLTCNRERERRRYQELNPEQKHEVIQRNAVHTRRRRQETRV